MTNANLDLTTGSITKKMIIFGIPIFLSNLLQALYNIVDMLVVGHYIGSSGIAAVSNASSIFWIITAISNGLSIGGTVLMSQYKGANNKNFQSKTVGTVLTTFLSLGLISTVLLTIFSKQIVSIMNAPIESISYANEFMFYVSTGWIFIFGFAGISALMRGMGNSQFPFYTMIISTVINIVLDFLFVGPMRMGVKGAAISTVIAEAVPFIISLIYFKKINYSNKKFPIKEFDKSVFFEFFKIGLPSMFQMIIVNISYLILTIMLNGFGLVIAAVAGVAMKILTFMSAPCWAVGQTVNAMVGQNIGANKIERTRAVGKIGLLLNLSLMFIVVLLFQIFSKQLFMIFDTNPEFVGNGILYMRIGASWGFFAYATMFTFDMFAAGTGNSRFGFYNSLIDALVIRVVLCWFLGFYLNYGFIGIYWGNAASSVIPSIIGLLYFKYGKWAENKISTSKYEVAS